MFSPITGWRLSCPHHMSQKAPHHHRGLPGKEGELCVADRHIHWPSDAYMTHNACKYFCSDFTNMGILSHKLLPALRIPATLYKSSGRGKGRGMRKCFQCESLSQLILRSTVPLRKLSLSISEGMIFTIFPLFFMNLHSHLADLRMILPGQSRPPPKH